MEKFYNYILKCSDGSLYSGYTNNPKKRLAAHNSGKGAKYTRSRTPVTLEALWQWKDKSSAMKAEYKVKQLTRAQKMKLISHPELLNGFMPSLADEEIHGTSS